MTEQVGKLLINTQDELKLLKNELELLQNPLTNGTPADFHQMLNKIKSHLNQFSDKINNKVETLVISEMNNHDNNLNKLPLLHKNESRVKSQTPTKAKPAQAAQSLELDSQSTYQTPNTATYKSDHRYKFMKSLVNKPHSNLTKKAIAQRFGIPLDDPTTPKEKTLKPIPKQRSTGKTSKPLGILPKHIRDNPFSVAPIRDKDVKNGIFSLITRGMVPKEVDLTPAFERGVPIFASQKMSILHPKSQITTKHNPVPAFMYSTRFDPKAIQAYSPADQPKQSIGFKYLEPLGKTDPSPAIKERMTDGISQWNIEASAVNIGPKDYEEVLDAYSLHQFIIRRGKVLSDTPEYGSFKRTYFGIWNNIKMLVESLEKLLSKYDIKVAYIDGKKLAKLAEISFGKPSIEELLDCVVNQVDVNNIIKVPQNMYKGTNGKAMAATKIQSLLRMFKAKHTYNKVKQLISKVFIIQKCIRVFLLHKRTLKRIQEKKQENLLKYQQMALNLQQSWPEYKNQRRVEIHIQSISLDELQRLSIDKFIQRQNAQIARLFALKDPLVDIIYIAPFDLPPEVISYYSKVFELGGLQDFQSRYHILWPENHSNFPKHFPTSRLLMYSPKVQRKIKELINGRIAYIVPSIPSQDDIELSALLNVPLFSGDPQKNALHSTKSGSKAILGACEIPMPPGSWGMKTEKEIIASLAKLIAYNFNINLWVFKIDDEFNGRGHATFSVDQIKLLVDLRNRKQPVDDKLIEKIQDILTSVLPMKIKINMPHLYQTYNEYITKFIQKGGVIEAAPSCPVSQVASSSIGFVIDPTGEVEFLGSYDKFFSHEYTSCGYFFPQKSVPSLNLQSLCQNLAKTMFAQGIFGYACLDIISFPDAPSRKTTEISDKDSTKTTGRVFWAVDLNCYMTTQVASTLFFDFLMQGKLDKTSGFYSIPKPVLEEKTTLLTKSDEGENEEGVEKRCFMYCPLVVHSGLASIQYRTFFQSCRTKGISYDLETKSGTTFVLLDSLQTGALGIITMGKSRREIVKYMNEAMSFMISQNQTNSGETHSGITLTTENKPDSLNLVDVASRVNLIHRVFEKKHRKID